MRLLAIDPGKHLVGAALWVDTTLQWGDAIAFETLAGLTRDLRSFEADVVVCEVPQVYRQSLQKGDPNDLIDVALAAGAALSCAPVAHVVRPNQWKGQVPKEIHNARVLRRISVLDRQALEKIKTSIRHNAIDAIGLGQWFLDTVGK